MAKKYVSRRDFLRLSGMAAAGAALAACGSPGQEEPVASEPAADAAVAEPVVAEQAAAAAAVRFTTQAWCWEKLNMATATDYYNRTLREAGESYQIQVDMSPQEQDAKVAQMIADNELLWNGHMRSTNLGPVVRQQELGILQPWDEYIAASSVPWAANYFDEVLPAVADSLKIDGKLYGLPWDTEVFTRVYNKMIWDLIGETPAETIDEFEKQLEELLVAAPDKTPMCLHHNPDVPNAHMFMQMWVDNPWVTDERGFSYLDVESEAYADYLMMIKRWWDKGIITADSYGGTYGDGWNMGNTATGMTGAAWLQAQAQKIWGQSNIIATNNPVAKAGDTPKTLTFTNCAILFKGAAQPQQTTDWLLWMFDPTVEKAANHSFIKGHLNYFHLPVYQSVYDNIVSTNDDWKWMYTIMDQVKASAPIPPSPTISIVGPIVAAWEDKYVQGEVGYDECIEGMVAEFTTAVDQALGS